MTFSVIIEYEHLRALSEFELKRVSSNFDRRIEIFNNFAARIASNSGSKLLGIHIQPNKKMQVKLK